MTLPVSGTIAMSQVNTELGLTSTTNISLNQAAVRTLAGIASGEISLDSLHGKSYRVPLSVVYSVDTSNAVVAMTTAGLSGYIAGKTDLTITVNSGVFLWSTAVANKGLSVTNGAVGDTLTIVNNGYIAGHGGDGSGGSIAANGVNSGGIGLSISIPALSSVYINNLGYIAGGGGGGGCSFFGTGGGGGAGGGRGGHANNTGLGGAGGSGPGVAGSNGTVVVSTSIYASQAYAGGGGGGWILPGSGGSINAAYGKGAGSIYQGDGSGYSGGGGGAGGAGASCGGAVAGAGGGTNSAGTSGTGGTALAYVGASGGGGGWGAAGGVASGGTSQTGTVGGGGTPIAGAGGTAILRGSTITFINSGTIYGAVG